MLSRIEDFLNSGLQVKVFIDNETSSLKINFNKDLFVHVEVIKTIEFFMQEAAKDKKMMGDTLVNRTAIWINKYLNSAFEKGLASLSYKPRFIKITRSY